MHEVAFSITNVSIPGAIRFSYRICCSKAIVKYEEILQKNVQVIGISSFLQN
jgi:hypothetical protein